MERKCEKVCQGLGGLEVLNLELKVYTRDGLIGYWLILNGKIQKVLKKI